MLQSTIIKEKCPACKKTASESKRIEATEHIITILTCGHTVVTPKGKETDYSTIVSRDGKTLFPYQIEDCRRAAETSFRCLFNHEFGVGKTVIQMGIFAKHPELHPSLFVVKSGLVMQYCSEIVRWTGIVPQILRTGKDKPLKIFKAYIVSYDLLAKINWSDIEIKSVFLDEPQAIKNRSTARSKNVSIFCKDKDHIIATSNTPIKNNAVEYFPILNILDPFNFHNETAFVSRYVDYHWDGYRNRFGGLSSYHADEFRKKTEKYIFRRLRSEVLPDLPKIFRQNIVSELDSNVEGAYEKTANQFAKEFDGDLSPGSEGIAMLSRMRHLCGLSKVKPCVEYITDFLINVPDEKITIFVHHKDVGKLLLAELETVADGTVFNKPLQLTSEQSLEQRAEIVRKFSETGNRILIASTLAAGEGLNLQFCSNAIILERQWNPANEEQAEGRFPRPGSTASQVNIVYMLAIGTIDEFLTEIVERKREYVSKTLDGQASAWEESSIMKELAEKLVSQQRKKWTLK